MSYNDKFRPAERPRPSTRPSERSTGYTAERPVFRTNDRPAAAGTNDRHYTERVDRSNDRSVRPYNNNNTRGNSRPAGSSQRQSFDNNTRRQPAPEVWITDSTGFRYKVID